MESEPEVSHLRLAVLIPSGGTDERDARLANGGRAGKTKVLKLYEPARGTFLSVGETLDARFKIDGAALLLPGGTVLVAGGALTPEIFTPETWTCRRPAVSFGETLNVSTANLLPDGSVLVARGYSESAIGVTDHAWLIRPAALG